MVGRRTGGKKRPSDRQPVLLETWREVVAELGDSTRLVIGGKSMGGRMASLVADKIGVAGLVALDFPFHASGKGAGNRLDHLTDLKTPALLVQGTRDALGNRDKVAGYALSPAIRLHWTEDGDHNLKPRKKSGLSYDEAMTDAIETVAAFAQTCV